MTSDVISCPACRRSVQRGKRICPRCGSGIAIVKLKRGDTVFERIVACAPSEARAAEELDPVDLDEDP